MIRPVGEGPHRAYLFYFLKLSGPILPVHPVSPTIDFVLAPLVASPQIALSTIGRVEKLAVR